MNQLQGPPNEYDFGTTFNYAVWDAKSQITLCNVKWNNDYRDIVQFPTDEGQTLDQYLDSGATPLVKIENAREAPINRPIRISTPFATASKYNYVRVKNPAQSFAGADEAHSFYYFIVGVNYVATNTTELIVQLDVWSTYGHLVDLGNCYIHQGHVGIANENNYDNYGRDFLTINEGLDTGSDLQIIDWRTHEIMAPLGTDAHHVLVASTVDLLDDGVNGDGKAEVVAAKGGMFSGLQAGATFYMFNNGTSFSTWLASVQNKPWIAQGIISVTLVPPFTNYWSGISFEADAPTPVPSAIPSAATRLMYPNWRTAIMNKIPLRWRHLKKLMTFPYLAIEVTTWSATPIILRPELWNDDNATLIERANFLPPAQRVTFSPWGYNSVIKPSVAYGDDGGDFLDIATILQNFPTMPIVNNMAAMYMASNQNQIAYSRESADWGQQKALTAAQTGYDQATSASDLIGSLGVTSRNLDIASTGIANDNLRNQTILGSVAGVAGGGIHGAVGGAAGAGAGVAAGMAQGAAQNIAGLMQFNANNAQLTQRNAAGVQAVGAQQGNAGYIRDTNQSLATYAARGDYANTIAGIEAKVQDSKFVQPTMVGQSGGDTLNLVYNNSEVSVRFKMIDDAHLAAVGDYFLRYGYQVNRFGKIDTLRVMSKFSYWKLTETYITAGTMPEAFKQAIRGIFEKGVTVWTRPSYIGTIDIADNTPLEGITL